MIQSKMLCQNKCISEKKDPTHIIFLDECNLCTHISFLDYYLYPRTQVTVVDNYYMCLNVTVFDYYYLCTHVTVVDD